MANYLIKKKSKSGEIVYMKYRLDGYNFKPRNITKANFSLEKIVVVKPSLIDSILSEKVEKKLSKIVRLVMFIINQDDESSDPSDVMLALNEIAKLRSVILNRYQDYLSQSKEREYLRKLRILENELRIKNLSYDDLYTSYGGPSL
ncbi:MAG: hypothetical protein GX864_00740 [Mollicutes bacterium]|jgi:ABC-type Fe3+-hydroxamate transport system substrate-binding protein|nr:hypothetical protein [Mollicutes bacterium]